MTPQRIERFEVVRELGRGRLGRVLEVRDPTTGRRLALKLLDGRLAEATDVLRFRREAEVMARVRHAHVVRVHEVGQSPAGPFFVSELVEGTPLDQLVARGPLPARQAGLLGRGVADGLAACHAEGIVHRDLKPANVVVRPDGSPVIIDFGVARDEQARSLTEAGALLGTPAYMAPEQVTGDKVDHRADLYGLGATLFACLTGRPPFESTGAVTGLLSKVLLDEPAWPTPPSLEVPPGLGAIVRRAMAKAPADRQPDASALRDELDRWLARSVAAEEVRPPPHRPPTRGPRLGLAALLLVALAAGGALLAHLARTSPPPAAPSARPARPVDPPRAPLPAAPAPTGSATPPAPTPAARARRLALPAAARSGDACDVRATFLGDGAILAGLSDGSVLRWPGVAGEAERLAREPGLAFTAIASLGGEGACLGTRSGELLVVRPPSVARLAGLPPGPPGGSYVWSVAHHAASGLLAVSLGTLPTLDREARSAGRLHVGRLVADGLSEVQTIEGVDEPAQGLCFSDDGAWLGVAWGVGLSRARGVVAVRLADGQRRPFDWETATPRAAVFLPGTHRLAVGATNGVIRAADLDLEASGFEVLVAEPDSGIIRAAHTQGIMTLAVRGRRLASSSWEVDVQRGAIVGALGDVRVWDLDHGEGHELLLDRSGARHLSFSPRGDQLLVSGDLGLLEVWSLGPGP